MDAGLEQRIQRLLGEQDLPAAATESIAGYGGEVLGFLVTTLRDDDAADEVFAQACEDLWRGLPGFSGKSSLRTWFYVLARHAAARFRRSPQRRQQRRIPLSAVSEQVAGVRSLTQPYLRSDVKDAFSVIRDALDEDDRALLVLRVDRQLDWSEVARVFSPADAPQDELQRASARLRKRFQFLKKEIRERARSAGFRADQDS